MSNNNANSPSKSDKYASFTLSIAALVVAGIALAVSVPRLFKEDDCGNIDLGIDYLGIIIGLLALMVTLMVAWNIWQTMEAKRSIEKFESKTENYDSDLNAKIEAVKSDWLKEVRALLNTTEQNIANAEQLNRGTVASDIYASLLYLYDDNNPLRHNPFEDSLYNFLFHSIKDLTHKLNDGRSDLCDKIISKMSQWLDDAKKMSLSKEQAAILNEELNKIDKRASHLKSYNEFRKKFNKMHSPF